MIEGLATLPGLLAMHRRVAAMITIVLLVAIGANIRAPVFGGSMIDEVNSSNPQLESARAVAAARGGLETLALTVDVGDVPIAVTFSWLAELERGLAAVAPQITVRSVHGLADQLFLYGLSPENSIADLLAAAQESAASSLVGRDAASFAVIVGAPESLVAEVLDFLEELAPPTGLRKGGVLAATALERDVASSLRRDLRLLIPLIGGVVLCVIWAAFGDWRSLVLPVFSCIASSVVVFALLSLSGTTVNLVTLLALPVVLVVGLANSCHFLAKSAELSESGAAPSAAIAASLRRISMPYLVSTLTTAVALASLGLNEIGPIRHFGLLAGGSLVVSFLLVMLAAPAALSFHVSAPVSPFRRSRLYRGFSEGMARHRGVVSALLAAASVAGVVGMSDLEVRSDSRVFFPDSAAFTKTFRNFEEKFYRFSPLRIVVRRADATVSGVEELQFAGKVRMSLGEIAGVREVLLQPAVAGGGFLLTALFDSPSAEYRAAERLDRYRIDNGDAFSVIYSSPQLVYEAIDGDAISSLARSLVTSVLVIFGAIALLVRTWRPLVAALAANAVPLLVTCAVVWSMSEPLNLVTAFVFLVALGVVVDDTIHILYQWRRGRGLAGSSIEFSVVLTTVILCLGMLLCSASDFPTTRQFAAYVALALGVAMISDLSVLPLLNGRRE